MYFLCSQLNRLIYFFFYRVYFLECYSLLKFNIFNKIQNIQYPKIRLFFLNQQFITWSSRADHGSYTVTTYMKSRLT